MSCSQERMAKLSNYQIEELVEKKGFKVVDASKYQNIKSDITIKCELGHMIITNMDSFRKVSFRCPECHGGKVSVSNSEKPPQKKGYRVIAFDNATEKMGVAIFDDGELVYYNLLKFGGNLDDRLVKISEVVSQVIIPAWKPDYLIFEDIQYQGNYYTYKTLAMLLGILRVAARKAQIKFEVIAVNTWRSHFQITGPRASCKTQAIKKVKVMYSIGATDDVAEAILLGRYAADQLNYKMVKRAF